MKIIDYQTLIEVDGEDFERVIVSSMEDGWQPFGGISVLITGSLAQAMVKYESTLAITPKKEGEELEPVFVRISENKPTLKDYSRSMTAPGDEKEPPSFGEAIAIAARELEARQATVEVFRDLSDRFHQRYKSLSALKGKTGEAKASKRAWLDCKNLIERLEKGGIV